ncbi:alpha/beta hydrolase [Pseudonocardia xishanensis]|uniref:Alpha/beta fold hydrolase n=1 Tax=Pseudonocardia xishanensis TaxID=630995 RepID=A0ABP8RHX2_9PSEU
MSPPGFGAPLPAGFGATMPEYRAWLVDELTAIGEPVDLVGYDWGGLHVLGVAITRPDLIRSWVSDAVGALHPDHVWHELARVWQAPGAGERAVADFFGSTERETEALVRRGFPRPVAERVAAAHDESTGRAVLALYRSAAQPALAELGRDLGAAARRPGLAVVAGEDVVVGSEEQRLAAAATAGARVARLDGLGHWWMLEDPRRGAEMLADFW